MSSMSSPSTPMEQLAARAAARRDAWEASQDSARAVSLAVLMARGAGAEPPAIAEIAAEPYTRAYDLPVTALTRQGVHKILRTRAEEIGAAWEAAARPAAPAALERLRQAVAAAIPTIARYQQERDWLAEAMWRAREAGHGPAAVADASGMASKAAYEYLAFGDDWDQVRAALADLTTERQDDLPRLTVGHFGLQIWVRNVLESQEVDTRMIAALAPLSWRIRPRFDERRFWGHWVPLELG